MIRRTVLIAIAALFVTGSAPSFAQSSLADIEKKLSEKTSELDRVDELLSSENRNKRIAAMELLILSGNPVFANRAKEIGLFSADPEMRSKALQAVFNSGGPFRLVLELNGDLESNRMGQWLSQRGSWDSEAKFGNYTFTVDPFDKKKNCWRFKGYSSCAIYLTGDTISLQDWSSASGSLTLGREGRLEGTFQYKPNGKSIRASIDLME